MERNYDEIIADILIQLDFHTQELTKQSLALERQTQALEKQSQTLEKQSQSQEKKNEAFISRMETMDKIDSQLLEQLVHSATILDRIIKKNDLRV